MEIGDASPVPGQRPQELAGGGSYKLQSLSGIKAEYLKMISVVLLHVRIERPDYGQRLLK